MKNFLCSFMFVGLALSLAQPTQAQERENRNLVYPTKPVRIVVGSAPGGGSDIVARLAAQKLSEIWAFPVIVENRSGAVFGLESAGRATPDGYSLGLAANSGYSAAVLSVKLPFDLKKSLEPIVQLTSQTYLLVANMAVPAGSVKELIAYAKSKPGVLNFGSTGHGTASHLGMELFNLLAGVKTVHIPFKGAGPAYIGLMSGEVQIFIGSMVSSVQFVKSGKLKALAVTAATRNKALPELMTIKESGLPEFELSGWFGLVGPAGLPASTVKKIHADANRALALSEVASKVTADGSEVVISASPADFRVVVAKEIEKWEKFKKATGIVLD